MILIPKITRMITSQTPEMKERISWLKNVFKRFFVVMGLILLVPVMFAFGQRAIYLVQAGKPPGPCTRSVCILTPPISPPTGPTITPFIPTSTLAPTLTPTPTQTTRDCNAPCGGNFKCQTGLKCVFIEGASHCRNPACLNDKECDCQVTTPTPTKVVTPTPIYRNCGQACNKDYPCRRNLKCTFKEGRSQCRNPGCEDNSNCVCHPVVPCDEMVRSGGEGITYLTVPLGITKGTFILEYETYGVTDRIEVIYEGKVLFDTGFVGTDGWRTQAIRFSGSSPNVTIKITGNPGTAWDLKVRCP